MLHPLVSLFVVFVCLLNLLRLRRRSPWKVRAAVSQRDGPQPTHSRRRYGFIVIPILITAVQVLLFVLGMRAELPNSVQIGSGTTTCAQALHTLLVPIP